MVNTILLHQGEDLLEVFFVLLVVLPDGLTKLLEAITLLVSLEVIQLENIVLEVLLLVQQRETVDLDDDILGQQEE